MTTWLLTWNPKHYSIERFQNYIDEDDGGESNWSCARNKSIRRGDRLFLIRLGAEPRGIVASGCATGSPEEMPHFNDADRDTNYVPLKWDHIDPVPKIPMERLKRGKLADMGWSPQGSGVRIRAAVVEALEREWKKATRGSGVGRGTSRPEDVAYWEGALKRMQAAAVERNAKARAACLAHHGTTCYVCGFGFEEEYGEVGRGLITVHHLKPLGRSVGRRRVSPERDMIPVCPNCHLVLHRKDPPYRPEEVKGMIRRLRST